jgi:hypothetical protein
MIGSKYISNVRVRLHRRQTVPLVSALVSKRRRVRLRFFVWPGLSWELCRGRRMWSHVVLALREKILLAVSRPDNRPETRKRERQSFGDVLCWRGGLQTGRVLWWRLLVALCCQVVISHAMFSTSFSTTRRKLEEWHTG